MSNQVQRNVSMNANAQMMIDSPTNCCASCVFAAPTTFRIPTSFARSDERAVVRLTKLMQAISKINMAMIEKM
jgi:hypothetical protein